MHTPTPELNASVLEPTARPPAPTPPKRQPTPQPNPAATAKAKSTALPKAPTPAAKPNHNGGAALAPDGDPALVAPYPNPVLGNRMPVVPSNGLAECLPRGLLLLTGGVAGSLGLILGGQALLRRMQPQLTSATAPTQLWRNYRWSWDPGQRREAALLLAAKDRESPWRRQKLLQGQGWGSAPIAAAVLLEQANTANQLGQTSWGRDQVPHLWDLILAQACFKR